MNNNHYESITFEVEKGLQKPKEYYNASGVKHIFSNLFKKRKQIINPRNGMPIYLNENEPLDILHYEFDTEETEFFNCNKKSLISGLIIAYKNHYPITISPDMIWLLILQGYSKFMEKYSEIVRGQYVNFDGKKALCLERLGIFPETATKEVWKGIIQEFTKKIGDNVGNEIISNLQSNFSTTNSVTLTTSQVSIMSAMKQYFEYKVLMGGCGISSIILEGSLEDWLKIKSKLEFLSNKCMKWWTKHLIPIIDNIIKTKECYQKNYKINSNLVKFWKDMIKLKGKGDMYEPHVINGWIVNFFPNYDDPKPKLNKEILETEVPDQIINCPMELTVLNLDGTKSEYKCDLASGFYGMVQNKETFNVRPVIGYAIVVDEKTTSKFTKKKKKKIMEEFFS